MIVSYEEFLELLLKHIQTGSNFYYDLLVKVIKNPLRYCGLFRLSNPKTKLIQNVTQSNEIKLGDIYEELTTKILGKLGYRNLNKNLGSDENNDVLNVDQLFYDDNALYMVEMKMRDDHDSTKKRGQFENYLKKIKLLKHKYNPKKLIAIMWFVDKSLYKNKLYYTAEMKSHSDDYDNVEMKLYYGAEFFNTLNNGQEAWNDLILNMKKYRKEHINDEVEIPDFGSSQEIFKALLKLPNNLWEKLISNDDLYVLLRDELFSNGDNIEKAKRLREAC